MPFRAVRQRVGRSSVTAGGNGVIASAKLNALRAPLFALAIALICAIEPTHGQIATTLENYFNPGTQPDASGGVDFEPILLAEDCRACHEHYEPAFGEEYPIYSRWAGSMMAHSARDPLFHACLAIANQDAAFAGDTCIRCHAPAGWLAGRSTPTDGSALLEEDLDGVNCNFCHRMVDPVFRPGISPPEDQPILAALEKAGVLPTQPGNGGYVVTPADSRRGPYDDAPNNHGVDTFYSPFHTKSDQCATCHDVSNPVYVRQQDGSYALNTLGVEHPTLDQHDMFPLERTYSEWANSLYATVGFDAGGVFGGDHPTGVMSSCQDCHMPDSFNYGCLLVPIERPDIPSHDFNGGNTWMPEVIANLYADPVHDEYLANGIDRAVYMLQHAATLQVTTADECNIRVRVHNETAHKLPTGYPEGRRMWIHVEFLDDALNTVVARGHYEDPSAELTTADTKVYEAKLGVDAAAAALTGIPEGPSFHFAVNNKYYKDNRIPPRGFSNAAFAAVRAAPVGATYADGQYWDDTMFRIPPGAVSAVVSLYYQTASKEYITFLRDANTTNDAGDVLFEQWELTGKSTPVLMQERTIQALTTAAVADADCDGMVDLTDYHLLEGCITGPAVRLTLGCEALDTDLDGDVDLDDFAFFQQHVATE